MSIPIPEKRIAEFEKLEGSQLNAVKERLGFELTKMIHGEEEAKKALDTARSLFTGAANTDNMPSSDITESDFVDGAIGFLDLMLKCELIPSKGEGRRLVQQGGVSLNDEKVTDPTKTLTKDDFKDGFAVIKKGKKVFHKVVLK